MDNLFMLTLLLSLVAIPISIVLRFFKKDTKYWKYAGIALVTFIVSFVGVGTTYDPEEVEEDVVEVVEEEEEEKEEVETEEEKAEREAKEAEKKAEKEAKKDEEEERRKELQARRKAEEEKEKQVKEYREFAADTAFDLSGLLLDLSRQTDNFSYTDEWVLKTAGVVSGINITCEKIVEYDDSNVPEECAGGHADYVAAANKYLDAMDLFVEGIDNLDASKIEAATVLLNEANSYIETATKQVEEANATLGL